MFATNAPTMAPGPGRIDTDEPDDPEVEPLEEEEQDPAPGEVPAQPAGDDDDDFDQPGQLDPED